ncbi:phage tail protein [Spirosoma linguale]|uniref:Tail Collar domain protein n=1 Tax=Spirosoma linguale (strain ATCC 33905 / DSM 74 / LMG 10896 / Claus 1) TaxID=504472 RepID=D2QTE9_SPILD|nr:Tail Collar domain protein [Spirosoma linguale DSM 74]
MDPFIGQIILFAGNYEIRGYVFCNGQLLDISKYTALYSLLGTTYGGNGTTTFGLPDLRGRMPIHFGQEPGKRSYVLGQRSGSYETTLTVDNLPAHNHALNAFSETGTASAPAGALLANTGLGDTEYLPDGTLVQMSTKAIGKTGNGRPVDTMPPYLALNYQIALEGIYPQRA